ncbi:MULTISPECIES: deoxyribose-phosphate aldolase [unclassified Pseudomonas]|uniref:deoxyribose-phosphate aldolase n=1 Tax=unclassified Pseudomonas TaxID=196821 RepID=UPI002AC8B3F8|nr:MULTISPECIES: deoxyribose-phosphate aldolase [unclassified Pseudomonas]MEB0040734.1 deoxyribose-phosphate aldolase [Pseudomonas sp. MH10]MEB0078632.1 deoxyribose-phosphate aldolase [Pseudomonas sp. MH10out]MEB0091675.1 deoxyribose-phosphate aldolase [Pseudomonas sp. CCI4.2]MEB0099923.1 deoxyribose-phosphate aldolase [Pseudomonas sp. CCI3.2]MEB0123588.1 deoxyribose-phosphate aldolase [Pseudomonas sp. CCI1.2]
MREMTSQEEQLALQMIGLLDLTLLNADDNEARVLALCRRAITPVGAVAAVCVFPHFVHLARRALDDLRADTVRISTVANYPYGGSNLLSAVSETRAALASGADEISLVYPYRMHLTGNNQGATDLVAACKAMCGDRATLKVILEAGELRDPQIIRKVCVDMFAVGADFIETSTGKVIVNATPQAARIILEVIAEAGGQGGFKAAGGIRTFDEARVYLDLAKARFGPHWVGVDRVRLGAASLLDDVLTRLGVLAPGR